MVWRVRGGRWFGGLGEGDGLGVGGGGGGGVLYNLKIYGKINNKLNLYIY